MKTLAKITFALFLMAGLQSVTSDAEAAHRGGGVANGFGFGINGGGNNGNGNGGGNNGNGGGNGGGGGGGGGAAASGGAQGAPAPLLAVSIFGQTVLIGGGFLAWRRRRIRQSAPA